ncbi:hypothetical protein KSP39_PZI016134 [Platanthera zijinensis]|uniref:Uncharacterized protein n=1 Tax=Platanthera zijinensis TaxID=2320716 RepID=A0AAP0B757_9ASPA
MEPASPEFHQNPQSLITRHQIRNLEGNGGIRGGRGQQRLSPPEAVNGGGSSPGVSPENGGSSSMSEGAAWPRIEITLSTQEKEADFMAFKGTKPSLRPKKRAKPVQKNVNVSIKFYFEF